MLREIKTLCIFILVHLVSCGLAMAQEQDYRSLLAKADSLKSLHGRTDERYLAAYDEAIMAASMSGEHETALRLRRDYVDVILEKYGEKSFQYAEGLFRLGNGCSNLHGSIDDVAIGYYLQAKGICESGVDDRQGLYGSILLQMLAGYDERGDADSFRSLLGTVYPYYEKNSDHFAIVSLANSAAEFFIRMDLPEDELAQYQQAVKYESYAGEDEDFIIEMSLALLNQCVWYGNAQKFEEALRWAEKACLMASRIKQVNDYYFQALFNKSIQSYRLERYDDFLDAAGKYLDYARKVYAGREQEMLVEEEFTSMLHAAASVLNTSDEDVVSWSLLEEVHRLLLAQRRLSERPYNVYINSTKRLFFHYFEEGVLTDAIGMGNLLLEESPAEDSDIYVDIMRIMGLSCAAVSDHERAIEYSEKLIASCMNRDEGRHDIVFEALCNLAGVYLHMNDLEKASDYVDRCYSWLDEMPSSDEKTEKIVSVNNHVASMMIAEGQYAEAIDIFKQSDALAADLGDDHLRMQCAYGIAQVYERITDYVSAEEYMEQALSLTVSEASAEVVSSGVKIALAKYKVMNGKIGEALSLLDEAKRAISSSLGEHSVDYYFALEMEWMAKSAVSDSKDLRQDAVSLHDLASEIYGPQSYDALLKEVVLVSIYIEEGHLDQALEHALHVAEHLPECGQARPSQIYNAYSSVGHVQMALHDDRSVQTFIDGYEAALGRMVPFFYDVVETAGTLDSEDKAAAFINDTLTPVLDGLVSEKTKTYYNEEFSRIHIYFMEDVIAAGGSEAITEQFDGIISQSWDDDSVDWKPLRLTFGKAKAIAGRSDDRLATEYVDQFINDLKTNLIFMSESDREGYFSPDASRNLSFTLADTDNSSPKLYDLVLYTKSALLGSNHAISGAVQQSGDSESQELYRRIVERKLYLDEQLTLPPEKRSIEVTGYRDAISRTERMLAQRLTASGLAPQEHSWETVRNSLGKGEAAIEFINYMDVSEFNEKYAALLMRHDSSPVLIRLGRLDSLSDYVASSTAYRSKKNSAELYRTVWSPLVRHLDDVETIYYSPSGILHNVNMDALSNDVGEYLGNVYHMVRCSTTEQIPAIKNHQASQVLSSVEIWGGLEYGEPPVDAMVDDDPLRSGWTMLPGSAAECDFIYKTLINNGYSASVHTGDNGDEVSFKALSGSPVSALHMSTHGFYIPPERKETDVYAKSLADDEDMALSVDGSLARCGLVLSGGNRNWNKDFVRTDANDGILTALEISNLDLKSVDLVVLSACETGLGDLSTDGVIGLQRAFKNAGAGSILMSLWKIDDNATRILMESFYRNLMEGMSVHDSFSASVEYLKAYDGGDYADPFYWASFVLLEG